MKSEFSWLSSISTVSSVLSSPMILAISIVWSWLLMGIVLWLPNIELIATILGNGALPITTRISLMLETYQLIFKFFGAFQLVLVILFMILSAVNTAMFLHVLHAQHKNRISQAKSNPALLTSVGSVGIVILGLMLLVPVVTTDGLVFGFNLHAVGVLTVLLGEVGMLWATHSLTLLDQTFNT